MLISKYGLDSKEFSSNKCSSWEDSDLKKWLNEDFFNEAFEFMESKIIIGNSKNDKVSLLSLEEIEKYFEDKKQRECMGTEYCLTQGDYKNGNGNCIWWSSTRYKNDQRKIITVNTFGGINNIGNFMDFKCAVRPVIWVKLA